MRVTLAVTYHDPEGRLYETARHTLPVLTEIFDRLVVKASPAANERSLALWQGAGANIERATASGLPKLGQVRRATVALALQLDTSFILLCDGDRALHWARYYPQELAAVVAALPDYDFTVLGRSERAFATHPRVQRDTEAIVNLVFAAVSGHEWDVTAAARGLSHRAAEAIVAGCGDDSIGVDVSWPLYLQQSGRFSLGYRATEGLEFETADRYIDEMVAAGGRAQWLARLDADPQRWAHRLHLARLEVEAMIPYAPKGHDDSAE
ncbi:MAG TPA: hypothetical protein VF177_11160 [Anaerolineae bacterium]